MPTYFWSFDKGLTDVIAGVQMTFQTPAPNLVRTTFGKKQMVLNYSLGYSTIPGGVYFETEFSVSCWVKIKDTNSKWPRLFDFSADGGNNYRIVLTLYGTIGFFFWFSNNGAATYLTSTTQLNLIIFMCECIF